MVEELAAAEHDLANELASREAATALFTNAWACVSGLGAAEFAELYLPPRHFDCHREVVASAELQYTDFSLQYHRIVVNLCEMGFAAANITAAFRGRPPRSRGQDAWQMRKAEGGGCRDVAVAEHSAAPRLLRWREGGSMSEEGLSGRGDTESTRRSSSLARFQAHPRNQNPMSAPQNTTPARPPRFV